MNDSARIIGILLAAGNSSRFGSNKLLYPFRDSCIVLQAAANLAAACEQMLVVCNDTQVEQRLKQANYTVVNCHQAAEGLSASIACGIRAAADADGWLIALGDMPCIQPASISQVLETIRQHQGIVAPMYKNQRGHPVGFSQAYARRLLALSGDRGAGQLISQRQEDFIGIAVTDSGVIMDIDQPEDLAQL